MRFFYDEDFAVTSCPSTFPKGRMTGFADESGNTTLCYDLRGNVIRKTQVTSGTSLVLSMAYSKADRLISVTYPSGNNVRYERDSQGRITTVKINNVLFISNVSYLPFGPVNVIAFANGKTLTKSYDQNYDIDSIVSTAVGGLNLDYSVDEVGNIQQINQSGTAFNLGYDKLYRLTNVKDQNQTLIEGFTYDDTGNRLSKQIGTAAPVNYSYGAADHKLMNSGTGARSFDANGNSTQIPGTGTLSYDLRNRLESTTSLVGVKPNQQEFGVGSVYNARGERVSSVRIASGEVQSAVWNYLYDETGKLLATGGFATEEIVYLDSTPVARIVNNQIFPLEADHLGSPRVMQAPDGSSAVWTWNLMANTATGSNAFGEQAPIGSQTFNLRFPGQYADPDGLHYNYFRDYEPATGRYVESDPIGLRGGVSTFGYVNQRPLVLVDPNGLEGNGCWTLGTCGGDVPRPTQGCCKTSFLDCVRNCRSYLALPDGPGAIFEGLGFGQMISGTIATHSTIMSTGVGLTGATAVGAALGAVGGGAWIGWNSGCIISCSANSCNYPNY